MTKTYRDSKGELVMEETFDGGRLTEQGREARINALLDAELGPGGFADTRSYAQRTEAEAAERVAREEGDRTRDANNARISDERSTADSEAAAAIQAMQDKGVGRVRSQKWDEQALQRASQMTESEKQARAWANRDRSKPASASEPADSEPENKPEPSGDNAEKHPNNDDAWLEKARNNVDKAFMKKWRYGGDARDAFREAKPKLIKWVSEKTKNNRYFTMPRGYRTEDQRMILEAVLEDMNLPKGEGNDSWILNSKDREELVRRINAISL